MICSLWYGEAEDAMKYQDIEYGVGPGSAFAKTSPRPCTTKRLLLSAAVTPT